MPAPNQLNQLSYRVEGQGESLVLLHGWGFNQAVWQSVAPLLKKYFTVITVDLPGFGESQFDDSFDFTKLSIVQQLKSILPNKCILAGWSLGGLYATYLARHYPEQVSHLILIASSPSFVAKTNWPGMDRTVLQKFNQLLQHDFEKTMKRFIHLQFLGVEDKKALQLSLTQVILNAPLPAKAALYAGLSVLETSDLRAELAAIKCPIFSLYGRLDSLVPVACAAALSALNSGVSHFIFPEAAHAPFFSHPQLFVTELMNFLGRSHDA